MEKISVAVFVIFISIIGFLVCTSRHFSWRPFPDNWGDKKRRMLNLFPTSTKSRVLSNSTNVIVRWPHSR